MTDPAPAAVRPAATLLLVRDDPAFEVLMVRRHHQIDFVGGALVFPGGKVEPEDAAGAARAPGLEADDYAARVAAVREAFEESGVLLAADAAGAACRPSDAIDAARAQLAAGAGFAPVMAGLGLRPQVEALVPFARWEPPALVSKRYDTRFYVAAAPADHLAACDGSETVDAEWIAPAEALRLAAAGERSIVFPTRMNLRRLAESASVGEALAAAALRPQITVQPLVERRGEASVLVLPERFGYGPVEEPFFSI